MRLHILIDRDGVEVLKHAKKKRGKYPAFIDRTSSVNKGFIICKKRYFLWGTERVIPNGQDSTILPSGLANNSTGFGWSFPLMELAMCFSMGSQCAKTIAPIRFTKALTYMYLCRYDYLMITSIYNENNLNLGKHCGNETGQTTLVTGDYAVLTFHADELEQRRGFLLLFATIPEGKLD